jgi:hypothetical protein
MADLPVLHSHPEQLRARVAEIAPSFYFFRASSWDTALSTGALGHMSTAEVDRYADMQEGVRNYTGLESQAIPVYVSVQSYVKGRTSFSPADIAEIRNRLETLRMYEGLMEHGVHELSAGFERASTQSAVPQ